MTEFVYFVLGLATSIILSPFVAPRLRQWMGRRSAKSAAERSVAILAEREFISDLRSEPSRLTNFLLSRFLLLSILWIGEGILSSVFDAVTSGTWAVVIFNGTVAIFASQVAHINNTVEAVASIALLVVTFRVGFRAYRIWRKVNGFDTFDEQTHQELASLREIQARYAHPHLDAAVVESSGGSHHD